MKITAKYVPQSEHDAVLADRDALAEQVAKLENARKATGDNRVGLIQAGQQGE